MYSVGEELQVNVVFGKEKKLNEEVSEGNGMCKIMMIMISFCNVTVIQFRTFSELSNIEFVENNDLSEGEKKSILSKQCSFFQNGVKFSH